MAEQQAEQAQVAASTAGDQSAQAQPTTGQQTQGGQVQQAQQQGRYVSDEDFKRYQRAEEQARGMAQFHTKASQLGIKSPEDLDRFSPIFSLVNERKIDPTMLVSALSPAQQKQAAAEDANLSPEEQEERLWARMQQRQAEAEHDRQMTAVDKLVEEQLQRLLGEDADEGEREVYRLATIGKIMEERRRNAEQWKYPEGHILHGKRAAPPGPENTKHIWDWVTQTRTKRQGAVLAGIGDAANKAPKQSTPAGQKAATGGGQQKADPLAEAHARMEAMQFDGVPA